VAAFPKDDGRPTRREQAAADYKTKRPEVRAEAHRLDGGRCVWPTCRRVVSLEFAHEHEVQWRSHGGDPLNLNIVVTTCPRCHQDIHPRVGGVRKKMTGSRTAGFRFYERDGEDWREVKGRP